MHFSLWCIAIVSIHSTSSTELFDLVTQVSAPAGYFQGLAEKDPTGLSYVSFRGIPYAKPPVGDLRFAKPQPLPRIDGEFDATVPGTYCPHPDMYLFLIEGGKQGSEDCLILNVYAKDFAKEEKHKNVLVYIHGGGYIVGTSKDYVPGHLVSTNDDVIVVTINYRLGILGFLSTGDSSSPGNNGLWDMTLALKWVKDNIESFGGDPNDITIAGESAGGSAVGYLSISPYTKGLFTRAFPQSGGPTSTFGRSLTPQEEALALAKSLGCFDGDATTPADSDATKNVVECLRLKPVGNFTSFTGFGMNKVVFVTTVDGDFIPKAPQDLLKDDAYLKKVGFSDRSYLVGINNNENVIFKTHVDLTVMGIRGAEGVEEDQKEAMVAGFFQSAFPFYVQSRLATKVPESVVAQVVDWYDRRHGAEALANIAGDLGFIMPTHDFLDAASRTTKAWLFHFNHYPAYMRGQAKGIIHGLDLNYWFDLSLARSENMLMAGIDASVGMQQDDLMLRDVLQGIIVDFVRATDLPGRVAWPEYNSQNKPYLDLKPELEVNHDLRREVRRFWQEDVPKMMEGGGEGGEHDEL